MSDILLPSPPPSPSWALSGGNYFIGALSFLLNSALLFTISRRTPKEMHDYKMFLLNITISDLALGLALTLIQPIPASSRTEVTLGTMAYFAST